MAIVIHNSKGQQASMKGQIVSHVISVSPIQLCSYSMTTALDNTKTNICDVLQKNYLQNKPNLSYRNSLHNTEYIIDKINETQN